MTYTSIGRTWAAGEAVVWLALTEDGGAYAETAAAVRAELQRTGTPVEVIARPWRELLDSPAPPPRLIVAVGVGALRGLAESESKIPLLATLVPRAAYQRVADSAGRGGRSVSAVWLDQPVVRQFDLLRLALPARHRIGVVLGPESRQLEAELRRAAAERKLDISAQRIDGADQLPGALRRVLDDSDILLALPDPQIYNGATIHNVLTSTYRQRIPLAGFSPAYVKAGALLAVYSTPLQVGTQTGEIVRAALAGRPLPAAQGPRLFVVGLNMDVARSLGIAVEADAAARWTEQLRRETPS
jgi:ABC-type uncharacterized transport system substrate-binding protein